MALPKSPSGMLAYSRRITRLVYLMIGVMVMIALIAGFVGAYTKNGGNDSTRPSMRRSVRRAKQDAVEMKKSAISMETIDDLAGRVEKPDLFEALKMAQKGLQEPRFPVSNLEYKDLHFVMLFDGHVGEPEMKYIRAFTGGLHRLRNETHSVPNVHLFVTRPLDITYQEEVSMWTNGELASLQEAMALPLLEDEQIRLTPSELEGVKYALIDRIAREAGHAIWVKSGYVIDPAHQSLKEAEKTEEPEKILEATEKGRNMVMGMVKQMEAKGAVKIVVQGEAVAEGYLYNHPSYKAIESSLACFYGLPHGCDTSLTTDSVAKSVGSESCGVFKHNPKSDLACNLDIKVDPIMNVLLSKEVGSTLPTKRYSDNSSKSNIKRLAVAMPTTSKGLGNSTEPVFFRNTVPSMLDTLTEEELDQYVIDVYIGYDHGDALFEDEAARSEMLKKLSVMVGEKPVVIKFIRFPKTGRVGMLWSMLFFRAMKDGADYFYQVNDDLTMVTSGWLSKFTGALDLNRGFGVVGPADNHNKFNCSLLTQAMVTRVHFDIFTMFYPTELKDWKTDRWLSNVYGPEHTFCWTDFIANNGGSKTRYAHCPFLSWKIYLNAGKDKIQHWIQENHFELPAKPL